MRFLAIVIATTACSTPATPSDDATVVDRAGACLGTVDGMAHLGGGSAVVGCLDGDPRCGEPPPENYYWFAMPAVEVEVEAFAIDLVEATAADVAAWAADQGLVLNMPEGPGDLPARNIPQDTAAQYCASRGLRLPRWFEWQVAAQGPATAPYPWGDTAPTCADAHHLGCGDGPAPVGGRGATACGVFDLAGNVAEYLASGDRLPVLGDASMYFFLGGSYETPAVGLRAYLYRGDEDTPFIGDPTIGFRCAKAL